MTPQDSAKIATAVKTELADIDRAMFTAPPDMSKADLLLHSILTSVLFIKYTLAVGFEQHANATPISRCPDCKGAGHTKELDKTAVTCKRCHGSGMI